MRELFLYTVAAFGLAYVVGHAKISLPFRIALEPENDRQVARAWALMLVECPACLGFWFGLTYALATGFTFGFPLTGWAAVAGVALYTCGANFLLSAWSGLLWEGHSDDDGKKA